jgi:hypothetical protein
MLTVLLCRVPSAAVERYSDGEVSLQEFMAFVQVGRGWGAGGARGAQCRAAMSPRPPPNRTPDHSLADPQHVPPPPTAHNTLTTHPTLIRCALHLR